MNVTDILGYGGAGIVALAYVPQIVHLRREHCSAGISLRAYVLWSVSSTLFLVHAVMIGDTVFTIVQLMNLVAISVITILVKRYGKHICLIHLSASMEDFVK